MLPVAEKLRNHPDLQFDMLVCLTAVDRVNMLEVIYHLRSTQKGYDLIVKTELTDPNLELPSVAAQW